MEQLPDDVLVMTMKMYLDAKDVLGCRLVCKRFAALVLHPDVWRDRDISSLLDAEQLAAVLHLAPCLNRVITGMDRALITTRCAIKQLCLKVEKEGFNATEYALVVRNQEALGRLKTLYLHCFSQVTGADALLSTLALCRGLETLLISSCVPRTLRPVVHGPPSASLKRFECELMKNSASFVNTILAAHSSTLEDVDLGIGPKSWIPSYTRWNSEETMRLLARIPKLGRLVSSVLPGLEAVALAARETLQSLSLLFIVKEQPAVKEAARTLRKANKLEKIYLTFIDVGNDQSLPDYCGEVIEAIASPFVDSMVLRNRPPMQSLARKLTMTALPALSLLSVLDTPLDDELDQLLLAITPHTAPALRRLNLEESGKCTHAWMHRDAVITVLSANPLLHILVEYNMMCKKDECAVCASGCHQGEADEEDWEDACELHLFSHERGKCPVPEDHEPFTNEIQMPRSTA